MARDLIFRKYANSFAGKSVVATIPAPHTHRQMMIHVEEGRDSSPKGSSLRSLPADALQRIGTLAMRTVSGFIDFVRVVIKIMSLPICYLSPCLVVVPSRILPSSVSKHQRDC